MKNVLLVFTLALLSVNAKAVDCTGKITSLGYDANWANPTIVISLEGGPSHVRICGLTEDYNGVNKDVCKIIHSELLAAKLADRTVSFRFTEFPDHTNCATIPSWQASKIGWHTFN